jgi:tetratricopeptide (TPR) repeat protein
MPVRVSLAIRSGLLLFVAGRLPAAPQAPADPAVAIPAVIKEGDAAYLKGNYAAARGAFDKAWQAAQRTPPGDPVRYDILKRLASVRASAGEFADADKYLQLAIDWRQTVLGPADSKIADDLLISVNLCRGMKDFERALVTLQRVQEIHVAASDRTAVAGDYSRLAQIYMEQDRLQDARRSLFSALDLRTKLSSPVDPALIPDLDRMGDVLTRLRMYGVAEAIYRQALVIRESLYGKNDAELISTVEGLAFACFSQGEYTVAEPLYQRLLSLWEIRVGKDHPMVAVALDKIAVFYATQNRLGEAREALERSSAIRAHFLAVGLSQQASEASAENHPDQAKIFYQRALSALKPVDPLNEDLRTQIEQLMQAIETPPKRPRSPR